MRLPSFPPQGPGPVDRSGDPLSALTPPPRIMWPAGQAHQLPQHPRSVLIPGFELVPAADGLQIGGSSVHIAGRRESSLVIPFSGPIPFVQQLVAVHENTSGVVSRHEGDVLVARFFREDGTPIAIVEWQRTSCTLFAPFARWETFPRISEVVAPESGVHLVEQTSRER